MEQEFFTLEQLRRKCREGLLDIGYRLHASPELGFREVETAGIVSEFLDDNGIYARTGVAVTGIQATVGRDGYHIALVADIDALSTMTPDGPVVVHSCGHSIQTAVMLYALKVIKESGLAEKTGTRVSFIATPAEEYIDFDYREQLMRDGLIRYYSGKQNMISQGIFDDVDCVISIHINGDNGTLFDIGSTLAGFSVKKITFRGAAAHSGAAPYMGKNALHGFDLFQNALAFLKDRFPAGDGVQIHPVLSSCGGGVNVIPDTAVLESYVRANTLEALKSASQQFDVCAEHCAAALGLTAEIKTLPGYLPLNQSSELNAIVLRNMLRICNKDQIVRNVVSGASGDIGDLSYLLPTVQIGFSGMKGRIHSSDFSITDQENAYFNTLRLVTDTVADLMLHPETRVYKKDYAISKIEYLSGWLHENTDK